MVAGGESQAIRVSICRLWFLVTASVEGSIPKVAMLIRDGMQMLEIRHMAVVGLPAVLLLGVSRVPDDEKIDDYHILRSQVYSRPRHWNCCM